MLNDTIYSVLAGYTCTTRYTPHTHEVHTIVWGYQVHTLHVTPSAHPQQPHARSTVPSTPRGHRTHGTARMVFFYL